VKLELRPYQAECVSRVRAALSSRSQSTLAVLPTGTGKTVIFGHIASDWTEGRILVIAHREELIFQACAKISQITGDYPDIEMAENRAERHGLLTASNVVVSSIQSQNAGPRCKTCNGEKKNRDERCRDCIDGVARRMQRFDPSEFGLLIIDESHHATASSYRRLIDYYSHKNPDLRILGVTATPDRADEHALGQVFDSVAFEYEILDAIEDGWLIPIKQELITCQNLDFSAVRTTAGDLNGRDLENVLMEEESLHEVTTPTVEISGDRPTLVFAATVAHAEAMSEIINRHKPGSAICIHGGTDKEKRRDLLKEYRQGKYQYLCGCGVFLEGFDEPRIEVVAMARPTKSRALYCQAIGRGTRPIIPPTQATPEERKEAIARSGKPHLLVLDFVGNSGRHKLISTADVLGGKGKFDDDIIARAVRKAKEKSGELDMLAELKEAQEEADEERKRKRREIKAAAKYNRTAINAFDVFDLAPAREPPWHKGRRPTEKMAAMLNRNGITTHDISFSEAMQLIGHIKERSESNLCTYKQMKLLSKYGQDTEISKDEASIVITKIKNNGWKPLRIKAN